MPATWPVSITSAYLLVAVEDGELGNLFGL